jgi:hypothetical protein
MMLSESVGPREESQFVEIRVFAAAGAAGEHPIELNVPGGRSFPQGRLRLDRAALAALELDPDAYGRALGKALFADAAIGPAYRETLAVGQATGAALRVSLRLDAPELQAIRWERVYAPLNDGWQPLGVTARTPFSRQLPAPGWERPPLVGERPLKLLLVIASPADLASFGLSQIGDVEREPLRAALADFAGQGVVAVTTLATGSARPATLDQVRLALAGGVHLVHFLCHGAATPAGPVLYLEGESGAVDPVEADRLAGCFAAAARPPLFCFLGACESAAAGPNDAVAPLALRLARDGGLQAVVAMTGLVRVQTALPFTAQFYARLLTHGLVDVAVNEARALVQDAWDWGTPVLYSRLADNQLFDFPVSRLYSGYLAHTDRAFAAADRALAAAKAREDGFQAVRKLEGLIEELSKSHKALVDIATDFRRVGSDPTTFQRNFDHFYTMFKAHYDAETWVDEDTSCRKINEARAEILPAARVLLQDDEATFRQLDEELRVLGDADANLLRLFRAFFDAMDAAVEAITARLAAGDVDGAIQLKRDFEAQISPTFKRSKAMFERMSASTSKASAA